MCAVIQRVDYVFAENGLEAYRNGQFLSVQVRLTWWVQSTQFFAKALINISCYIKVFVIVLSSFYHNLIHKQNQIQIPEHEDVTSCDRPQEVYSVCLLLSVHPGAHGGRATARFYQLLSQLHGQDQTAQEEVQTCQSPDLNVKMYLIIRIIVLWFWCIGHLGVLKL